MQTMTKIRILSVHASGSKKDPKKPIGQGVLYVHADETGQDRQQISLLPAESIQRLAVREGRSIAYGAMDENLTVDHYPSSKIKPLDRFANEKVELEVVRVGHGLSHAKPPKMQGRNTCLLDEEGLFTRVIRGGPIQSGDELSYHPKSYRFQVITLSDRASQGVYRDLSGPRLEACLERHFQSLERPMHVDRQVIPDDADRLRRLITKSVNDQLDAIFTTGGTGVGPRDCTVDVVRTMLEVEIPGVMELIRVKYGLEKPFASLSRGVAGFLETTLIYTLPGSVRAVDEYMDEILKTLEHLIYMRQGLDMH